MGYMRSQIPVLVALVTIFRPWVNDSGWCCTLAEFNILGEKIIATFKTNFVWNFYAIDFRDLARGGKDCRSGFLVCNIPGEDRALIL